VAKPKTWADKIAAAKPPHTVRLEKPFAGVPAGAALFIASPAMVRDYAAAIPRGEARTVEAMRADFARGAGADAACPASTSIFVRIVAEAALEEIAAGRPPAEATPFWRLVEPGSKLAAKLSCGPEFVAIQRAAEGIADEAPAAALGRKARAGA